MEALILFLIVAVIAFFHGFDEGYTMLKPGDKNKVNGGYGARGHKWFKTYHVTSDGLMFLVAGGAIAIWELNLMSSLLVVKLILCGLTIWHFKISGYNYCRYDEWAIEHEHWQLFDLFSINVDGLKAMLIYHIRFIIMLLFLGGIMLWHPTTNLMIPF